MRKGVGEMIPNYQIDILKKERERASILEDKILFVALTSAIRVLETHKCNPKNYGVVDNSIDAFKDNRGESQAEKFGY